jgi:hypothetical protein
MKRSLASAAIVIGLTASAQAAERYAIELEVGPIEMGHRPTDQLPARVDLDFDKLLASAGAKGRVDFDSMRITPAGDESGAESLPFRWYDADVPDPFPEFIGRVNSTDGELKPRPSKMAGHLYNAAGRGRQGFLVFIHTQRGRDVSRYTLSFDVADDPPAGNGPRG